jgi:hypothetical protein
VTNTASVVPTTELAQVVGVPFVRTGTKLDSLRGGVEAALTKHTSLVASSEFQWVSFDQPLHAPTILLGGHSVGGTVTLRHQIDTRTTISADYDQQHATIGGGDQRFDIQNLMAGVGYKLSNATHAFASAGVSHLNAVTTTTAARFGPAIRLGLGHQARDVGIDLLYSRSFVPSFGFGGTSQNEETTALLKLPLARHLYARSAVSWRRNDPLTLNELPIRSLWFESNIGYVLTSFVRVEAFYSRTHQRINRPGGTLDRNRVGFLVITAKPVRIR